jgi:hypothetical protein
MICNACYVFLRSMHQLLVTVNIVLNSPTLATLMMEALYSSETSVLTRATRCNIPENGILHSHRRKNLRPYLVESNLSLDMSPPSEVYLT